MRAKVKNSSLPLLAFENKRDAYGFAVRPQHFQRYKEYANIYKEEEEERSERWSDFLERQASSVKSISNGFVAVDDKTLAAEPEHALEFDPNDDNKNDGSSSDDAPKEEKDSKERIHRIQIWSLIRPSLGGIEQMMSVRVKKKNHLIGYKHDDKRNHSHLAPNEETMNSKGITEDDSEEEFYDVEKSDPAPETSSSESTIADIAESTIADGVSPDPCFSWREELESLVRGGLPMALRGELWQAFVGVKTRRVKGYYQELLAKETSNIDDKGYDAHSLSNCTNDCTNEEPTENHVHSPEKWKGQIEKDLPRTFPGHPALDEDGRNALRRLLTAYARHNPYVGYCQAMNFFAGLLLLLMSEENAFWTLVGIIDDYFDGYYSEEMIESQVDQLVFEELVRQKFPKLVKHLDYLGVQVAWVSGPWFLSIFVNVLPWETVLRVWDVLLFDGNRVMLFQTALALMELYGPALVTTKDAGDAVTLLQSLAGSTFDSSQLVLTACMGYQTVNEPILRELRGKHRPEVLHAMEERSNGICSWKDSKGLASKLYNFKHDPRSLLMETTSKDCLTDVHTDGGLALLENNQNGYIPGLTGDAKVDTIPDLKEQVVWLKVELCKLLEEKRSTILRGEELEIALMEMVKQDNRRSLSAKIEQLEQEVSELQRAFADKQEQEHAMLQVLMRVEQEQKVTEDARLFAEQDASAQRYAAQMLQEKYEETMNLLAQMEKRAVMAETMLEATLQYQASQSKAQQPQSPSPSPSPRSVQAVGDPTPEIPGRKIGLLSRPFGLSWRDKNKGKPNNFEEAEAKSSNESGHSPTGPPKDLDVKEEAEK